MLPRKVATEVPASRSMPRALFTAAPAAADWVTRYHTREMTVAHKTIFLIFTV